MKWEKFRIKLIHFHEKKIELCAVHRAPYAIYHSIYLLFIFSILAVSFSFSCIFRFFLMNKQ